MAEEKYSQAFDLLELDVRLRRLLRKLEVDTAEKLLSLTEAELSAIKNCGAKTIAKIMLLQKDCRKEQETIGNGRRYMNRLIIVATAGNKLIEGAEKSGRYHFRVSRQRLNALRQSLEALRK